MKIKIKANEITDGEIDFVSLVKHGANRSAFKIVKTEEEQTASLWAGLMPELDRLQQRLASSSENVTMETKTVATEHAAIRKAEEDRQERTGELRQHLDSLNNRLMRLWENPTHPLFKRLDDDLSYQIEKAELELGTLADDTAQMNGSSAFFRRGGTSLHSQATPYDSADEVRAAEVRKTEQAIDLSPTVTTTDEAEVAKIDLSSLKF